MYQIKERDFMKKQEDFPLINFIKCGAVATVAVVVISALIFTVYFGVLNAKSNTNKSNKEMKKEQYTTGVTQEGKKRYKGGIYVPETTTQDETPDVVYETTTEKKVKETATVAETTTASKFEEPTTKHISNWNDLFPPTTKPETTNAETATEPLTDSEETTASEQYTGGD